MLRCGASESGVGCRHCEGIEASDDSAQSRAESGTRKQNWGKSTVPRSLGRGAGSKSRKERSLGIEVLNVLLQEG